jgi:hypothetical protein
LKNENDLIQSFFHHDYFPCYYVRYDRNFYHLFYFRRLDYLLLDYRLHGFHLCQLYPFQLSPSVSHFLSNNYIASILNLAVKCFLLPLS